MAQEPSPQLLRRLGASTNRRNAAIRAALQELEDANDALAAGRSQAAYDAMIQAGQADALLRLDRARARARALLSE